MKNQRKNENTKRFHGGKAGIAAKTKAAKGGRKNKLAAAYKRSMKNHRRKVGSVKAAAREKASAWRAIVLRKQGVVSGIA